MCLSIEIYYTKSQSNYVHASYMLRLGVMALLSSYNLSQWYTYIKQLVLFIELGKCGWHLISSHLGLLTLGQA